MPLNIVFAGTSPFAVASLEALIASEHNVTAVYTQPDRPSGRGLKLTMSAVKQAALAHNLPVHQPASLKDKAAQQTLKTLQPDIMIVVVYGLLIPKAVLEMPRFGCINVHPSLLPRWRGAAPIQRAIEAGDTKTGITIMQLDEGWDTGDILTQTTQPILPDDTSQTLHDRLAEKSAAQLVDAVNLMEAHQITPTPQDHHKAIHAEKLVKTEGHLDWQKNAETLSNKIRAFNSWPVAYTTWEDKTLRIWAAQALNEKTPLLPGTIVTVNKEGLDIACGENTILRILRIQLPGGKPIGISDFIHARGKNLSQGKKMFD